MYYFCAALEPELDCGTLDDGFENWFEVEGDIDDFIFYNADEEKNCSER